MISNTNPEYCEIFMSETENDIFVVDHTKPDTRPICTSPCHETHCCTIHGCKYGQDSYGDEACPITRGVQQPAYDNNNGCEMCEWHQEEHGDCIKEKQELVREHEEALATAHAERDEALRQVNELTRAYNELQGVTDGQ